LRHSVHECIKWSLVGLVTVPFLPYIKGKVKGKAIPVTGREDPEGCETSRFPHFLDNRLTDGGEVISPTRRPPFSPQEDSWYSFVRG
jgi:hypothetical protein